MSIYYRRIIEERLTEALNQFPVTLITGPRQAGKSTLLRESLSDYRYVTLDDPINQRVASEDPELFLSQYKAPLIIDEAQYAPQLFPYLKMIVDQDRHNYGQYVLTGSQTFQLMEGVTETLAGRIAIFHLYPFSWMEVQEVEERKNASRDVESTVKQILQGFYPEFFVTPNLNWNLWHGSYLSTYVERDIRNIRAISDLGRFQTFIGLLASRAGQLLNISEVAKECGISQPTAKDWITILESTYVIYLLKPYFKNQTKRLVRSPKLYFVDTGILCHLLGLDSYDRFMKSSERGHIFENMVVIECLKRLSNRNGHFQCYFYRTASGIEVDLVVEHGGRTEAYEIKFAKSISKSMAKPLTIFGKENAVDSMQVLSLQENKVPITKEIKAFHWDTLLLNT